MRPIPTALLAALLLAGAAAPAASAAQAPPRDPTLGVAVDVGVPQGATLSLAFRPTPAFRIWAGPAWNYVAWGVQGGFAVVPWRLGLAPSLSAEVGHYFRADLTPFVNESSGAPAEVEPLLREVGYTYAAAHLGLEIGSQRGLSFSLRAGLAYVIASSQGRADASGTDGAQVTFRDPRFRATAPSVKLGIQYYF